MTSLNKTTAMCQREAKDKVLQAQMRTKFLAAPFSTYYVGQSKQNKICTLKPALPGFLECPTSLDLNASQFINVTFQFDLR